MTRLILVKHSLPAVDSARPAREWTLSAVGRIRAEQLAEALKNRRLDAIISSTEPKAQTTAEILAERLGLDHQVADGLHEHDRSHSPYYSNDEFQKLIRDFFDRPDELIFGKETAREALTRFRTAVNEVLAEHPEKDIVIVTHGTVISLFVAELTGMNGHALWRELGLPAFVTLDLQSKTVLETVNLP